MNGLYRPSTRNRAFVLNRSEELRAKLGEPNEYGEWSHFPCPRCGGRSTHCAPAVQLARCWECGWTTPERLAACLRARDSAPDRVHSDTRPREMSRRRDNSTRPPTPLRVYQVPA